MDIMFDHELKREEITVWSIEGYFNSQVYSSRLFESVNDFLSLDFDVILNNIKAILGDDYFVSAFDEAMLYEYLTNLHPYFCSDIGLNNLIEGLSPGYLIEQIKLLQEYVDIAIEDSRLYERHVYDFFANNILDVVITSCSKLGMSLYKARKERLVRISPSQDTFLKIYSYVDKRGLLDDYMQKRTQIDGMDEVDEIILERLENNPDVSLDVLFEGLENLRTDKVDFYSKIVPILAVQDTKYLRIYQDHASALECAVSSVFEIIKHGYRLKKCLNCNKYFVPLNRSDTIYCDRKSPQDGGKTCKEYGAYKQHQENLKANKAAGLYRKIYMQKQMATKRNPDIETYKKDFEDYKIQSKQWKSDVNKGVRTEAEFLAWLKSLRRKGDDD